MVWLTLTLLFGVLRAAVLLAVLAALVLLTRRLAQMREIRDLERLARELTEKARSTYTCSTFTSWQRLPVGDHTRNAVEAAKKDNSDEELVIGHIDQEGRFLGTFGRLPGPDPVDEADFLQRIRFGLDVVLIGDNVLVRKDYRGNRVRFAHEWCNLALLHGKANVPAIYRVDEHHCRLYMNLVPGRTIQDILSGTGAKIQGLQTRDDAELAGFNNAERLRVRRARGSTLVSARFSEEFLQDLERQLDAIHSCGVCGIGVKSGNVIVDLSSDTPWFIDFEGAKNYRSTSGTVFRYIRDRDRARFNQVFGRNLMTRTSARTALAHANKMPSWYAPIDFGDGLTVGSIWSVSSGTGRWEFFNKRIVAPLVAGKKVLDLGSNNGVMPMMMLRAGAREVSGVELSSDNVGIAELIRRIYEWRDMRQYDLSIYNHNMLDILHKDWGSFDVVTAFCSLYYLLDDDMARVVRRSSELASTMVLQANIANLTRKDPAISGRASVSFLRRLLEDNGFSQVEVFAPPGYSRPLLVGTVVHESVKKDGTSIRSTVDRIRQEHIRESANP